MLESGQTIAEADVWLGAAPAVPLVAASDLSILVPTILPGDIAARVEYDGPIAAPITAGQEVARLIVEVPGLPDPFILPLVAGAAVAEGGFLPRMRTAARILGGHLGLSEP